MSERVAFSGGGFDRDDLWRKLGNPDLAGAEIVYGSGLENRPALLDEIAGIFPLLGNLPPVVANLKAPRHFFALLDALGIAYPETRLDVPLEASGWLVKGIGGSGGTHIRAWCGEPGEYYQRQVDGLPVSVLFLADGERIEVVGYNEQWLAPAPSTPFRYGGAVSNADLPAAIKRLMADAARKVSAAAGLRGLNSMDFMLSDDIPLALEINPRLSATFDLYDIPDLFERHVQACRGQLAPLAERPDHSRAHLIHYANFDIGIDADMPWPEWAADLPPAGMICRAGEPLCTVLAAGENAAAAKRLVFARQRQLDAQLRTFRSPLGKQ